MTRSRSLTDGDVKIAQRVKTARMLASISQADMALALGISFQQFQKYEGGANRISAGKLALIAIHLKLPITWFYEDMTTPETADAAAKLSAGALKIAMEFEAIHSGGLRYLATKFVNGLREYEETKPKEGVDA